MTVNIDTLENLSDSDLADLEGGLMLTCPQIVIMGGAAIGGTLAAFLGTPGSAPFGGFLGGIAGGFAADFVCR
jgi:hypothetical protein